MYYYESKIYNSAFDIIEMQLKTLKPLAPMVISYDKDNDKPTLGMSEKFQENTKETLKSLREEMEKQFNNHNVISYALCYDTKVTDPRDKTQTDAICMELKSTDFDPVMVFIPYRLTNKLFRKSIELKKPFAMPLENNVLR